MLHSIIYDIRMNENKNSMLIFILIINDMDVKALVFI